MPRKNVVLIVIDGLTPAMLEAAVESKDVPALRFLFEHGEYRRAVTTFPSLTPVCLSSLATGVHPDVHGIPHLVWFHRAEGRFVEYGSSFSAVRAAGTTRGPPVAMPQLAGGPPSLATSPAARELQSC